MTSWGVITFLVLLVSLVELSKEDCIDYFRMESWKDSLTKEFALSATNDFQDLIECTLEQACNRGEEFLCFVLDDCIRKQGSGDRGELACVSESHQKIAFYHLMCLTAKALNHPLHGCEYENVCRLYPTIPVLDQTTALPPTARPTTVLQPVETVLPTTTTVSPKTSLPPTASTVTQSEVTHVNVLPSSASQTADTDHTKYSVIIVFLVISILLNIVLLSLILKRFMHRRTRDKIWTNSPPALDRNSDDLAAQPMAQFRGSVAPNVFSQTHNDL